MSADVQWLDLWEKPASRNKKDHIDTKKSNYQTLIKHLKTPPKKMLEIGCGMAREAEWFHKEHKTQLWLLDGDKESNGGKKERYYQYGESNDFAFYNTVENLKKSWTDRQMNFRFVDANKIDIPRNTKFDMICSFKACGFHFPVSDYLQLITKHSDEDTRIILDIRRDHYTEHMKYLEEVEIIEHGSKHNLVEVKVKDRPKTKKKPVKAKPVTPKVTKPKAQPKPKVVSVAPPKPKQPIVLASCNQEYYDLYGASFEASLKKLDQPYHIHHCEAPPSDWVDAKPGHIIGMDKTWYACSRYYILPEMIEEHGGVFVSDIDVIFTQPVPFPKKEPIGRVKTSPKNFRSEWEQRGMHVMAGFFYCSDVDIAKQIRDRIDALPKRWFVDQVAIREVMLENNDKLRGNVVSFNRPPTKLKDMTNQDFAVVPRGRDKLDQHKKILRDQLL